MTDSPNTEALIAALKNYEQADEYGVMVLVSREACEKAGAAFDTLTTELAAMTTERDEAIGYATRLLTAFVMKHCSPVPTWKPLPNLLGVLMQLDNATTITDDIKAELARMRATEAWKDIESAPKDGTEIIGIHISEYEPKSVYGPWTLAFERNQWRSSWDGSQVIEYHGDFGTDYKEPDLPPTHWKPLNLATTETVKC